MEVIRSTVKDLPGAEKQKVLVVIVDRLPSGRRAIARARFNWRKFGWDFEIRIDDDHLNEGWLVHEFEHCHQVLANWFHGFFYDKFTSYRYKCELKAYVKQYEFVTGKQLFNRPIEKTVNEYANYLADEKDYGLNISVLDARKDLIEMILRGNK